MRTTLTTQQMVRDVAERAGWTFAQNFAVVLVATGSAGLYDGQAWGKAFSVAAWATLIALVVAVVGALANWHPTGYLALAERAFRTALQSFLAALITSQVTSFTDAGAKSALALAVATAFMSALKSVAGLANGTTLGDATAVPVETPPQQVTAESDGTPNLAPNPDAVGAVSSRNPDAADEIPT